MPSSSSVLVSHCIKSEALTKAGKAKKSFLRNAEMDMKKTHRPIVDRQVGEPSPFVVAVVGPPKARRGLEDPSKRKS